MTFYDLVEKIIFKTWEIGKYEEVEDGHEVVCNVTFGPLSFVIRDVQVLDCHGAYIELRLGDHWFGFRKYYGSEQIGSSGFYHYSF